jgi:hypothetical protein
MIDKPFKIKGVVDAETVPSWTRRESKWEDLVEAVLNLAPGKSLEVEFPDKRTAERARNAVRDTANLRLGKPLVRTRIVEEEGSEEVTAFITLTDE